MTSGQGKYHGGIDRVQEKLRAQGAAAGELKNATDEHGRLVAFAAQKCQELLGALDDIMQHQAIIVPLLGIARNGATETVTIFQETFPDIKDKPALQAIAGGLTRVTEDWNTMQEVTTREGLEIARRALEVVPVGERLNGGEGVQTVIALGFTALQNRIGGDKPRIRYTAGQYLDLRKPMVHL